MLEGSIAVNDMLSEALQIQCIAVLLISIAMRQYAISQHYDAVRESIIQHYLALMCY